MKLADYKKAIDASQARTWPLVHEMESIAARVEAGESGPEFEAEKWRVVAAMEAETATMERLNAEWKAARRSQAIRTIVILVVVGIVCVAALVLR